MYIMCVRYENPLACLIKTVSRFRYLNIYGIFLVYSAEWKIERIWLVNSIWAVYANKFCAKQHTLNNTSEPKMLGFGDFDTGKPSRFWFSLHFCKLHVSYFYISLYQWLLYNIFNVDVFNGFVENVDPQVRTPKKKRSKRIPTVSMHGSLCHYK